MNDVVLNIADFFPESSGTYQLIESEPVDLLAEFKKTRKGEYKRDKWLYATEPKKMLTQFRKEVKVIEAAGGLVKNGEGAFLFIFRLGKWDLPKGKIDAGERSRKAAVREVEEECGLNIDYLGPKLISTYHMYELKGTPVLKRTKWYEMAVNKKPKLTPQLEEDITEARWLHRPFEAVLSNTYPLIRDVLEAAGE